MNMSLMDLMLVTGVLGIFSYKVSYLHRKEFAYFSLFQILLLLVFPAIAFVIGFFYLHALAQRNLVKSISWMGNVPLGLVMLSATWAYAGAVIHAIAKMFSDPELLRFDETKAGKMNRFFHLEFSHNVMASGVIMMLGSIALAEVSRVSIGLSEKAWWLVFKGLMFGLTLSTSLYFYTRSVDGYKGYWRELRWTFVVSAGGLLAVLAGGLAMDVRVWEYETVVPVLVCLFIVSLLGAIFLLRKWWRWLKQKKYVKRLLRWK